jgi:hypothetical protein
MVREEAGEQMVEHPAAHRLGEDVGDAEEVGILFPLPLPFGGINENRAGGREADQFLDRLE